MRVGACVAVLLLGWCGAVPARAAPPTAAHVPTGVASPHRPYPVVVTLSAPESIRRAAVRYRALPSGPWRSAPLAPAGDGRWRAVLPAGAVGHPGFAYFVEVETPERRRVAVFASEERPFPVQVGEDVDDVRDRQRLERAGGATQLELGVEHAAPGPGRVGTGAASQRLRQTRATFAIAHRLVRPVERVGLTLSAARGEAPASAPDQPEGEARATGLYAAQPAVGVRLLDALELDAGLVVGVHARDLALGATGALLLGEPRGQRLALGAEHVAGAGERAWLRLQVGLVPGWALAPTVELTTQPAAREPALRLLGDLAWWPPGGLWMTLRAGWQASDFARGGPVAGLTVGTTF